MMQKWFNGLNKIQGILIRLTIGYILVSLIFFYDSFRRQGNSLMCFILWFLGVIILVSWLYLEFGRKK